MYKRPLWNWRMRLDLEPRIRSFSEWPTRSSRHPARVSPARRWVEVVTREEPARRLRPCLLENPLATPTLDPQDVAVQFDGLVVHGDAGATDPQGLYPDCPGNVSNHTMTFGQGHRMPPPDPPGFGASRARGAADCKQILRFTTSPRCNRDHCRSQGPFNPLGTATT